MKFLAIFLLVSCSVAIQAQVNPGTSAGAGRLFMGFPPSTFFQNVVLESEAQKLLTQPGFPEDLQQRVLTTLANADSSFSDCNTTAALPWFQIRCITMQLSKAKTELKAIEDEAKARADTPAATSQMK